MISSLALSMLVPCSVTPVKSSFLLGVAGVAGEADVADVAEEDVAEEDDEEEDAEEDAEEDDEAEEVLPVASLPLWPITPSPASAVVTIICFSPPSKGSFCFKVTSTCAVGPMGLVATIGDAKVGVVAVWVGEALVLFELTFVKDVMLPFVVACAFFAKPPATGAGKFNVLAGRGGNSGYDIV